MDATPTWNYLTWMLAILETHVPYARPPAPKAPPRPWDRMGIHVDQWEPMGPLGGWVLLIKYLHHQYVFNIFFLNNFWYI